MAGKGDGMRVLVVDRKELYRCQENVRAVVVIYKWGCRVIIGQGMYEYCYDLQSLLTDPYVSEYHLRSVRQWLERYTDKPDRRRGG